MTTRELDYKLARDISRIRMVYAMPKKTLSEQLLDTMADLDAAKEQELIKEVEDVITKSATHLKEIMTIQYAKATITKMRIREAARAKKGAEIIRKFSESDRTRASRENAEIIARAAGIVKKAIDEGDKQAIINASIAEACEFCINTAMRAIEDEIRKDPDKKNFSISGYRFSSLANEAVEHLEKVVYYGKWIYERFQPSGIIAVTFD